MSELGFSTTEAGGGSYPEPPEQLLIRDTPECETCGWQDAKYFHSMDTWLCDECHAKIAVEQADYDEYTQFILDNFENQTDFFVSHFFDNLSDFEQLNAAKAAFSHLPQSEKHEIAQKYVADNSGAFADFWEAHGHHD